MNWRLALLTMVAAATMLPGPARAQSGGRIIVSTPAGGGLDTMMRRLAGTQSLRSAWGGAVVIDNLAGSNGLVAIRGARGQRADGSTVVAVFISEADTSLAASGQALSALDGFVPIAYLGSNTGNPGRSWYGVFGPPGMSPETAARLEAALQAGMASNELASITETLPGWKLDQPVSAGSLRSAIAQTANMARQAAPAVAASTAGPGESLCELAGDEWSDRQRGETREKYPFLAYLRVSNKTIDKKVHEFDHEFFTRCAADEAEFQERTQWITKGLEQIREHTGVNCGGMLGNGGPRDEQFSYMNAEAIRNYNCDDPIPEGFDEWFAKYREDARIALENARAKLAAAAPLAPKSAADEACATRLGDIGARLEAARRDIPRDSVVVLSEATMWALTESIAAIKSHCPGSAKYQPQSQAMQATWYETRLACNAHASRTCTARLPTRESAPRPSPAVDAPPKPLAQQPPASCDEGTGANWASCLAQRCAAQGGKFSLADCAHCAAPGNSWTQCPKGSGGVSSAQ